MKSVICAIALLSSASSFASAFECANTERTIVIQIDDNQESGYVLVDGKVLDLGCTGRASYGLTCKAFKANSFYEVYVHKFITRSNMEIFAGHVTHTIGGIAGNVSFDLGGVGCTTLKD